MKTIGYVAASGIVLGLAAFTLQDAVFAGSSGSGRERAPLLDPVVAAPPSSALDAAAAAQESDEAGTAAPQDGDPERADEPRARDRDDDGRDEFDRRDDDDDGRSDRRRRRWRSRRYVPRYSPEDWEPPPGPVRIALQVGHWRTEEAPPELSGLRGNGTRGGGLAEWQVNLEIAKRTKALLEEHGYAVDILPAVVPPAYRAHLFIAIHADGSADTNATGYRIAAPRRDATGRASRMVELLEETYGAATGLPLLPTITRRMTSYYAFNARRYEHSLHPLTIAVIIETGFLTSAHDRRIIVDQPDRAARGIVDAVLRFPETPPPGAHAAADTALADTASVAASGTAPGGGIPH